MANSLLQQQFNQACDMAKNPYGYLIQMANVNPSAKMILQQLQNGINPEQLVRKIMSDRGINANDFINMVKNNMR